MPVHAVGIVSGYSYSKQELLTITVTAYYLSKQLQLFAFVKQYLYLFYL